MTRAALWGLLVTLAAPAAADTTISTLPVGGQGIGTRGDIGQSFTTPASPDRVLRAFTTHMTSREFITGQPIATTFQFNLFAFNDYTVVGAPVYRSEPRTLPAGTPFGPVTVEPNVELGPGGNYLAVYSINHIAQPPSAGLYFVTGDYQNGDPYPGGRMRLADDTPFPYQHLVWSDPNPVWDLGFVAEFVPVPEPLTLTPAAVTLLLLLRRRAGAAAAGAGAPCGHASRK